MVKVTSKKGIEKDLCLDFDAIVEMEQKDPNYSFLEEINTLSERPKVSTIDKLTRLIYEGKGWKEFSGDGFTMDDLVAVLKGSMVELGFTSEASASRE